jgi:hypothetical protein
MAGNPANGQLERLSFLPCNTEKLVVAIVAG